jgi:signal transduction histidine kinase
MNNVLATILAEADLALADIPIESDAHGCVARIDTVACKAAEMMTLLMEYSGTRGNGIRTPTDVTLAVGEMLRLFRATVPKKVSLTVELSPSPAIVLAERSQIQQVVLALLTNAYEALEDKDGSIRVITSFVDVGTDASGKDARPLPGRYVCVEVADAGCGIPADSLDRIFDPFYTTKGLGRGLGLASVRGIVRTLAGSIEVQSAPGRGSSFQLLLPCCEDPMKC